MKSHHLRLDELPVEILRHIASVGVCETVLALSEVNKTLRAALHDGLVYKAIIENRNGNGGLRWHHHIPLSLESSASSWARYALADSRAARITSLEPVSILSWAPQLLAQHCKRALEQEYKMLSVGSSFLDPFVNFADLTLSTDPWNRNNPYNNPYNLDRNHALAFCLAMRLIYDDPAISPEQQWYTQDMSMLSTQAWRILSRYLRVPFYSPVEAPDTTIHERIYALLAVGLLSLVLRRTIERDRLRRLPNVLGQTPAIAVPTLTNIPFNLTMDLPLPFSPGAITDLVSCHLAKMTTIDFLQNGEWEGFYSINYKHWNRSDWNHIAFDPPMRGIHFVATADIDRSAALSLHGTGEDGVGAFNLDGRLARGTGQIVLKKVYEGGHPAWDWDCLMTPVGIFGSWGTRRWGGWVWLWKTSWTADH